MEVTSYKTGDLPQGPLERLIGRLYPDSSAYAAALAAELVYQLDPANPFLARGSRENFIVMEGNKALAHACAIGDSRLPAATGLIGYFEAADEDAAALVLEAALKAHAARGVKAVYGPVNDTVWQRYGAAAAGDAPPYCGEPYTPAAYAEYFKSAGFVPADHRLTTAMYADEAPFGAFAASRDELVKKGFSFAEIGPAGLAPAAAGLHALATIAFGDSPLFVPAGLDEFLYSAGGQAERAGGSVLFMAGDAQGKPAAFLWGLSDGFSSGKNFIFKTIAVRPDCRGIGLGSALFYLMHERLKTLGAKRCIFSTMRSQNRGIAALTARGSVPYREYQTFKKELC